MKIINYKIDNYNESTRNWSSGYKKTLEEVMEKINQLNNGK